MRPWALALLLGALRTGGTPTRTPARNVLLLLGECGRLPGGAPGPVPDPRPPPAAPAAARGGEPLPGGGTAPAVALPPLLGWAPRRVVLSPGALRCR